ncbi:ABC transporter permease [Nonomuraea sp. NPDC050394]|uniref:ABC transporter permease n=1 Tax=Nonomuraea sp. NPDC050394 TaxID=3364363 RepID=UPI0037B2F3AA
MSTTTRTPSPPADTPSATRPAGRRTATALAGRLSWRRWALVAPAVLATILLFVAPLGQMVAASFTGGASAYRRVLSDGLYLEVTLTTLRVSLIATAVTVAVGYATAWCMARCVRSAPVRRALLLLLVTPLFISAVVRSFAWLVLLGKEGLVNDVVRALGLSREGWSLLYNETGVIIGLVYILLPYTTLSILSAFEALDGRLERAAADLGATAWRRFTTVTLPLTVPGVASGALMAFAMAVTGYVTPAVLSGGQVRVLSMLIYEQTLVTFDWVTASVLAVLLLALSLTAVIFYLRMLRRYAMEGAR